MQGLVMDCVKKLTIFGFYSILTLTIAYDEELLLKGRLRKACSTRGNAIQPTRRVDTTQRLSTLREKMQSEVVLGTQPIQGYIVTSSDEHQSVEIEEYERRREYISGFSGSYGDAIITLDKAALWTDGRYHLQADEEMHCHWLLFREGLRNIPTRSHWLKSEFPNGARVGVNPKLISEYMWNKLSSELSGSGIELIALNVSLIDVIWPTSERGEKRSKDAFILDVKFAGKNYTIKLEETRRLVKKAGADAMVVTSLDEVAWLLNLRGRDVPFSPFVRSYVLFDMTSITLYVNSSQLESFNVMSYLQADNIFRRHDSVQLRNYSDIWADLRTKSQLYKKILVPSHCVYSEGASHAIYEHIFEDRRLPKQSPIIYLKAIKNEVERQGMRTAHIKDAAALCDCFAYIEKYFQHRLKVEQAITEERIAEIVNSYRFEQNLSLGNSFRTIVGFGPNGAQPRYIPTKNTNAVIYTNSTVVVESGGQYYGTTDVTRTLHFGTPDDIMVEAYTRVLIGNIKFSSLTFPNNTKMADADVLARRHLWEIGLDYLHETGHGVGSFLGVRESPIVVQYDLEASAKQTFKPGYFLTNEPGYYREGYFGVRLQNVLEVVEKPWLQRSSGHTFLGFQIISLVPYEVKLINFTLLTIDQKKWLNWYNEQIRQQVGAELKRQHRMDGFYWMMRNTKYIPETASGDAFVPHTLLLMLNILYFIFE
ncbi:xaa-Pro aminopeptidase 1-like isoform X2 [Cylas formicarius]|uniref:xaa-Pro aminopeptidase 1-like isoform X2 n=1 Tax=Cylas formicarius TaxID=197179 RepID=UPI00295854EB|nr:xaa-Pro aminopeptidase 1-like isoform X2 [Cylas formicarius]